MMNGGFAGGLAGGFLSHNKPFWVGTASVALFNFIIITLGSLFIFFSYGVNAFLYSSGSWVLISIGIISLFVSISLFINAMSDPNIATLTIFTYIAPCFLFLYSSLYQNNSLAILSGVVFLISGMVSVCYILISWFERKHRRRRRK